MRPLRVIGRRQQGIPETCLGCAFGFLGTGKRGEDVDHAEAEVELAGLDLRGFQQQVEIANKNLKSQQKSADLTRRRFAGTNHGLHASLLRNSSGPNTRSMPTLPVSNPCSSDM